MSIAYLQAVAVAIDELQSLLDILQSYAAGSGLPFLVFGVDTSEEETTVVDLQADVYEARLVVAYAMLEGVLLNGGI